MDFMKRANVDYFHFKHIYIEKNVFMYPLDVKRKPKMRRSETQSLGSMLLSHFSRVRLYATP